MVLPPVPRLLPSVLALALLLATAVGVAADGAVISTTSDEPMPASRVPVGQRPTAGRDTQPTTPPKSPCPHPHKCAGTSPSPRT